MITSNFSVSLSFLRFIYPSGPWMLTAISIDKKFIEARTFDESEEEEVLAWLSLHKQKNLYYSVNKPIPEAREKKKLAKSDVASVHYLHVDVDPRAGEDVEREQARIHAAISSYRIPPSVVVFSGGGYNALWRLEEPVDVANNSPSTDETIRRALDVERRNWQFELDFETPDHCRDVSRILRLPGTINRPNDKKIAQGRVTALARIDSQNLNSYAYDLFMATPLVSSNISSSISSSAKTISEDVVRTESLDGLRGVPDRVKVIIAQGFDPENKKDTSDRSATLYYVCCELVRLGLPDPVILGLITDSRYAISESVLDKGTGVTRYALRQIQRARDNADHPLLAEMNAKYAVILNYGSAPAIMIDEGRFNEQTQRHEPVFQSFRAFKDRIKNLPNLVFDKGDGKKTKPITAFDWWTAHGRRRTYEDVMFEPGLDTPNRYNLWSGFSCMATPGDKHLRFLDHTLRVICSGNEEHYGYLLCWMARVVQQPRTTSMVAPVLLGERGTGKSVWANYFGALFEPHHYVVSDVEHLTGRFNAYLASSIYVVAEEAFDLRNKRHESVLKELITGKTRLVERKNVDVIQLSNYVHLVMTSNNDRVVPAGDKERRFFVIRVSESHIQDAEYFRLLLEDQRSGGLPNLLHHLMSMDISRFDVTDVPQTTELRRQQEHNLSNEHDWLMGKLESGQWLQGQTRWEGPVRKKALHEDYKATLDSIKTRFILGERAFHNFIMRCLPGTVDKQVYGASPADRPMVFIFPPLAECREAWDKARGWTHQWRDIVEPEEEKSNVIHLPGKPFE